MAIFLIATTIADSTLSQESQSFNMNVISLPEDGASLEFIRLQLMEMTTSEIQ